jgi:hypothetical protein
MRLVPSTVILETPGNGLELMRHLTLYLLSVYFVLRIPKGNINEHKITVIFLAVFSYNLFRLDCQF